MHHRYSVPTCPALQDGTCFTHHHDAGTSPHKPTLAVACEHLPWTREDSSVSRDARWHAARSLGRASAICKRRREPTRLYMTVRNCLRPRQSPAPGSDPDSRLWSRGLLSTAELLYLVDDNNNLEPTSHRPSSFATLAEFTRQEPINVTTLRPSGTSTFVVVDRKLSASRHEEPCGAPCQTCCQEPLWDCKDSPSSCSSTPGSE